MSSIMYNLFINSEILFILRYYIYMKKIKKTNAMRILDQKKIEYIPRTYDTKKDEATIPTVFKTLVTVGKSNNHYVFMLPLNQELDLKVAAHLTNEKSIHMIKEKELLNLTGYIHGGCSPIGMKKFFDTYIDISAQEMDSFLFSAGQKGVQLEMNLVNLSKAISLKYYDAKLSK